VDGVELCVVIPQSRKEKALEGPRLPQSLL
jgi:hypothetical protein